jgi:hypothetical protein
MAKVTQAPQEVKFKVCRPRWCPGCAATVTVDPCPACQVRRWAERQKLIRAALSDSQIAEHAGRGLDSFRGARQNRATKTKAGQTGLRL